MAHGIKRALTKAQKKVRKEIEDNAAGGSKYARGLANEGFAGGYAQALSDVMLALNGVTPQTRGYWDD